MAELSATFGPWWPYLALVLIGFLPTEIWRVLAVLVSRGLSERSGLLVWVRSVATTLLAAVVAKLVLSTGGALAAVPFGGRVAALACGIIAFQATRQSVLAGVLAGEAVLIAIAWLLR